MSGERDFIDLLRGIATHPAARDLSDDAALLKAGGETLVLTHDMLVEGVHFLPDDPPFSLGWKLVAVNMSDLAAKGATPVGVLMGAGLAHDSEWAEEFVAGLHEALRHFDAPLLGGDTVHMPTGGPLTFGLTAIGKAPADGAPSRGGAQPGDEVWVTGTIGDAGLGLLARQGKLSGGLASLNAAYQRPRPSISLGQDLAPLVTAMMDVSDGLLIDASRISAASGCGIAIELDAIPLSNAWRMVRGATCEDMLAAATMGDDYRLLFTARPTNAEAVQAAGRKRGLPATRIGRCTAGENLSLTFAGTPVELPERLGFEHG